ncbi:ATP-binding protein [Polaribacter sp. R2A056_3_33]|uniref:ATP-binding protein n=1 Tax=Polaribacter sp. R2A056_3_33 TaxID=2745563 RepID=UPI001C4F7DDE|nr:ATP-binding protein [Polaribacter sp. R2A056_3_33]QXP71236.1 ATP-binding protein [Polaribacter sp. R2A056_3_33]
MADSKVNGEVIAVLPNKVKIKVDDLNAFKGAEQLKVGSYIQIADNENSSIKLIAIIESFLIEVNETGDRKYLIEANPLGTIEDGNFRRGGDSIALPPKEATKASVEDIRSIYASGSKESKYERFCFAELAQSPKERIEVPVNGNKFFNKHFAIVGSTGSGKSHTTAKVLQNATKEKKSDFKGLNNSHIIIFDIHSEYSTAFPNANIINIDDLVLPYWLLNADELEELFLESGDNNNYNQSSILRAIITENKESNNPGVGKVYFDSPLKFDINEVLNCFYNLKKETVNSDNELDIQISPSSKIFASEKEKYEHYFKAVYDFSNTRRSSAAAGHGISNGIFADGKIDKFISRLSAKVNNPRLQQFLFGSKSKTITFEDTLKQFLGYGYKETVRKNAKSNVTIIDLSGVPFEVLSITVSLISRLLFDFAYYYKKNLGDNDIPLLLVYEEAHKYVPKSDLARFKSSRASIERIAKEGRKYGISLAIVSQRPSELSETIFSQCNNFIAMRLTNPEDQNYVKRLLPDSLGSVTDILPSLQSGEALLIGEATVMPSIIKIDRCEHEPSSNDILYLEKWKNEWNSKIDFKDITAKWMS